MNSNTLKMILLPTGLVMLAIGMISNIQLYASLASSPQDKLEWSLLGFCFDVAKVSLVIVTGYFWYAQKPIAAILSALAFLVLTGLSLLTLFGNVSRMTAESERAAAVQSTQYLSATETIKSTENQISSMAAYASLDVAAIQSQVATLQSKKANTENELKACPAGYVTKCIKPAQTRIAAIDAEIKPLQAKLDGRAQYDGLQNQKQQAIEESKNALANGASVSTMAPLFVNFSHLVNTWFEMTTTPYGVKIGFLAISSLMCELLATFLLYTVAFLGGPSLHGHHHLEKPVVSEPVQLPSRNEVNRNDVGIPATTVAAAKGKIVTCPQCGKDFERRTTWQKYCSENCRNEKNGFVPRKRVKA